MASSERSVASLVLLVTALTWPATSLASSSVRPRVSSSSFCPSWLAASSLRRASKIVSPEPSFSQASPALRRPSVGCSVSTISSFSSTLADIALKFFSSAATLSAFGATAARSSRLDARLTKPTRSAKPCDTGTWVETSLSSVIIDLVGVAAQRHGDHGDVGLGLFAGRKQHVVELGLGSLGRLHDLFAAGAELETIVDRPVERAELGVHRRNQLLQPVDRLTIGLGAGDLVEPLGDAFLTRLQRGHFLLPLAPAISPPATSAPNPPAPGCRSASPASRRSPECCDRRHRGRDREPARTSARRRRRR